MLTYYSPKLQKSNSPASTINVSVNAGSIAYSWFSMKTSASTLSGVLGSLADRLHHQAEAVEAYRACLSIRFSPKALTGILKDFEREKNTRETVASVIRLVTWQYRWYSEFSPELLYTIRTLIEDEGAVKVRSIIQATSLPQNVLDLTHHYAALCAAFRSSGTEG
jgi:hypothetical protein